MALVPTPVTEEGFIYRPYITKNGKRIYRKGGGMFKIPISTLKDKQ
ncbi:hypothetical protein PEC301875_24010 [Pectobacterium carotovorum subsp. carotovorum]|nr:hypothetical protein PEC301875_24010 [Pectobacterium carotovorum subsp. carotovorum]